MNVAFNMVGATHGGGFLTYNYNILKGIVLENDNNEYFVFINKGLFDSFFSDIKNIHLIAIPEIFSKMIPRLIWMQTILPIYLIINKIDVVLSPMNIMPIIIKLFNIKNVLVIHSNLPWLYPNDVPGNKIKLLLQKLFTNISIMIADKIIVDSKTAKKELTEIFPKIGWKTNCIYLGVDQDRFINNNNDTSLVLWNQIDIKKEPYFLTISSAVQYHCLKELIIAYEKLSSERKNIPKYLLISKNLDSKYFKEINTLVSASHYSKNILLIENINYDLIPSIYRNSELYIFSSNCEVFGFTNLEAMSAGIPVLTSNKSAIPEICGNAAMYFNPNDPTDIKNKIISIYYNDDFRQDMIEKGYNRVKKFTWENTINRTRKIILE